MDAATLRDRAAGCVLGLALGDALGAEFEGGPLGTVITRGYRWMRGEALTYTDDAEMMIGLVESLLHDRALDIDHLAGRFIANDSGFWRGYGPGTRRVLAQLRNGVGVAQAATSVFPDGSLGNGAAMRVAPVGPLYADAPETLRAVAERQAAVTHTHPLGREGAVLIARAAGLAFCAANTLGADLLERLASETQEPDYREKLNAGVDLLRGDHVPRRVARQLGHGVVALESVPTAIYLAARFGDDFDATVKVAIELGGDTDTIAAMAGGIVGARLGRSRLPGEALARIENAEPLDDLASRFSDLVIAHHAQDAEPE